MVADVLAKQGARASAAMKTTWFAQNNPISAYEIQIKLTEISDQDQPSSPQASTFFDVFFSCCLSFRWTFLRSPSCSSFSAAWKFKFKFFIVSTATFQKGGSILTVQNLSYRELSTS